MAVKSLDATFSQNYDRKIQIGYILDSTPIFTKSYDQYYSKLLRVASTYCFIRKLLLFK